MKKTAGVVAIMLAMTIILSACSNETKNTDTNTAPSENQTEVSQTEPEDAAPKANVMIEQGNPLSINLADIAEASDDTFNAWIKISTMYDPDLSMYVSDLVPAGTTGIVVDFTVSDMDVDEATLYWCYELTSGENTISLWDNTSPAEKLTIKEDGSYRMVFDAEKALGGPIDAIGSLQIVFPGLSETTTTKFTVTSAGYLDSSMNVSDFKAK